MKYLRILLVSLAFGVLLWISSCDKNGDFLLFSIEDDIALGNQVAEEIANDPEQFPVLDKTQYAAAYAYLQAMLDEILDSEDITYRSEFPWVMNIIDNDGVLNAFATPGGHIYVYTGLIYFLDHADDLAGVLGHEIAHADQRHSSKQLQRIYGISILLSIIAGQDASTLTQITGQIAGSLAGLSFSRSAEAESDEYSVKYLASTTYACNGAAAFFEKLLANEAQRNPEFLSTHPSPDSRVADINAIATDIGCTVTLKDGDGSDLDKLKALIP